MYLGWELLLARRPQDKVAKGMTVNLLFFRQALDTFVTLQIAGSYSRSLLVTSPFSNIRPDTTLVP